MYVCVLSVCGGGGEEEEVPERERENDRGETKDQKGSPSCSSGKRKADEKLSNKKPLSQPTLL